MSQFAHAQLLISAASPTQFPPDRGIEIAIAGRSNAGKSSAINAITGRRRLARTSKTPGRTRLLNFFELAAGLRLVDLPGYGYAAGARSERDEWARLIAALAPRRSLHGLMLVVDARRGLQDLDQQLLGWATQHGKAVHVLLSKSDQLKRAQLGALLGRTEEQLGAGASAQLFSVVDGTGVEAALAKLLSWAGELSAA